VSSYKKGAWDFLEISQGSIKLSELTKFSHPDSANSQQCRWGIILDIGANKCTSELKREFRSELLQIKRLYEEDGYNFGAITNSTGSVPSATEFNRCMLYL
jgi:hypothetical protein